MMRNKKPWIICQLGAREHYSIARALHGRQILYGLITDTWVKPGSMLSIGPVKRLRQRYHPELDDAHVIAWPWEAALRSMIQWRSKSLWEQITERNEWFAQKALHALKHIPLKGNEEPVIFSFSYTARSVFEYAKHRGWRTILGQIDCGEKHWQILRQLERESSGPTNQFEEPPASYWQYWREELKLADEIIANSSWAARALAEESVPPDKIHVIPLAYKPPPESYGFQRAYPAEFSNERPLRVLFLGAVNRGKGAWELQEAANQMQGAPVQFTLVGQELMEIPVACRALPSIRWVGAVPRDEVAGYYRDADVFLFPSHSDGFGLTQLEAQAWKLPVIASRCCGEVVTDRINGLLLPEVSCENVSGAIRECLGNPAMLAAFASNSVPMEDYGIDALGSRLTSL
jgi:glycosyltransferase involved in cell wall biosynthesis